MMVTLALENLTRRLVAKTATVGFVGLGYVGLPMLVAASRAGYPVVGFDSDPNKVQQLQRRQSYVADIRDDELAALTNVRFVMTPIPGLVDVWVIAVPTPLHDGHADLRYVTTAAATIGAALEPGNLVCLESTTFPGTTEEVVRPILENVSGLRAGKDFALVYSPERIDPGSGIDVTTIPKLVGGLTPRCTDLGEVFYGGFVNTVVRMKGLAEAEMAKLLENTYRQVNIALVNQLATVAPALGVDLWDAIRGASTKPFGFMAFRPGPGVGGHCISIDPLFLADRARAKNGWSVSLIEAANEVNAQMPRYIVNRIADALNDRGRSVRDSRILALGLAYKSGVADTRESPALQVFDLLMQKGAQMLFHDPFVLSFGGVASTPLTDEVLESQDCVLLLVDHPSIDYERIARISQLVFDARGVLAPSDRVVRL